MDLKKTLEQPIAFRRKVFKLAGNKIFGYDPEGKEVMFVKQKAFKLKEDIRVYSDKSMSEEVLYIQARQVIDVSATYDVTDQTNGEKVGALRRKGLVSTFAQDTWEMLDNNGNIAGEITEDSTLLGIIRRYATNLIPQAYNFTSNGTVVAELKQKFNPFVLKAGFSVKSDAIDPRLCVAGAVLLMCIEGRQK